jgi:cellulose synthase A
MIFNILVVGDFFVPFKVDESRQALSRKIFLHRANKINLYKMVIIMKLVIVAFFFHYRILNHVRNAFGM